MSERLPDPLTPPDCDLTCFDWFRLYHRRLKQSEWWLEASDLARSRNVDLWCEAADQVPAASLPDSDAVLARFAGFGRSIDGFLAHKAEIMEPWLLCSDGRWYHPTLAEAALEGLKRLTDERRKLAADRHRKKLKNKRSSDLTPSDYPDIPPEDGGISTGNDLDGGAPSEGIPPENPLRGGEDRIGEKRIESSEPDGSSESVKSADDRPPEGRQLALVVVSAVEEKLTEAQIDAEFEQFWAAYPNRVKRSPSRLAFGKKRRGKSWPGLSFVLDALAWQSQTDQWQRNFVPHATTYINAEQWNDEPAGEPDRRPQGRMGGFTGLGHAYEQSAFSEGEFS